MVVVVVVVVAVVVVVMMMIGVHTSLFLGTVTDPTVRIFHDPGLLAKQLPSLHFIVAAGREERLDKEVVGGGCDGGSDDKDDDGDDDDDDRYVHRIVPGHRH